MSSLLSPPTEAPRMQLHCGPRVIDLTTPVIMGVLNVTPDSFSDGGRFVETTVAVEQGERMLQAGATLIDIGGESTRPGAGEVSVDEELRRVIPVVERLARSGALVSIDTSKPQVMRAALDAGAVLVNDVFALRKPGAVEAVADTAGVCLMHMPGDPRTMQSQAIYADVVSEVMDFLRERIVVCKRSGIAPERIVIDPGIGFGKLLDHNLALLAAIPRLRQLGLPVLIGVSRKSMLGTLTGRAPGARENAGVAVATAAALAGASIIRTHDVESTLDALKVAIALRAADYRSERA